MPMLRFLACAALASSLATVVDARAAVPAPASIEPQSSNEFPADWFWRTGRAAKAHPEMTGKAPPALDLTRWHGDEEAIARIVGASGDEDPWKNLRGKVVVVDFWATWCGPCVNAIPKNVALVKEYAADGLVFLGVHDAARGSERMTSLAKETRINYPLAVDNGGKSARAWNVSFWPTYAVIDRKGIVRAIGLQPQHVRAVVEKLIAEAPPEGAGGTRPAEGAAPAGGKSGSGEATIERTPATDATPAKPLDASLLEGKPARRAALAKFDSCPPAPALGGATTWTDPSNSLGGATSLEALKGKIVVLDFWATWCGPCIASIPKNNEIARKFADRGVVLLGVCHPEGGEKMLDVAKSKGIAFPTCLDARGEVIASYVVDSYPDYYLIDREGRLRGADVGNGNLEKAIESLLAEDGAASPKPKDAGKP
jgi:cytochrome c biogenesis protein CcmG/thiol:disulfide interchange protein DsbE